MDRGWRENSNDKMEWKQNKKVRRGSEKVQDKKRREKVWKLRTCSPSGSLLKAAVSLAKAQIWRRRHRHQLTASAATSEGLFRRIQDDTNMWLPLSFQWICKVKQKQVEQTGNCTKLLDEHALLIDWLWTVCKVEKKFTEVICKHSVWPLYLFSLESVNWYPEETLMRKNI